MNKEYLKNLCTPAKIYLAIAFIASIIMLFRGISLISVLMNLFFAGIWTIILGWLCKKGFSLLSWFLVLLPYILMILVLSEVLNLTSQQRQMLKNIKLQGLYGKQF
jgi:hypothetical protein